MTSLAANTSERKIERLQEQVRDVDRDIEDARDRVQVAERAQWSQISYCRRGDAGRTVAIVAVIQGLKKKAQKQVKKLQSRKAELQQNIENEHEFEERRQEDMKRREEAQKERLASLAASARNREEGDRAQAEQQEKISAVRTKVEAREEERNQRRAKRLGRDDDEPGHEPEIGF